MFLWQVIANRTSCQWETHAVFGFLGHNFGSRYVIRLIKDSVDADDDLVSKKTLSQNIGSLDWLPGPVKVGQNFKNIPTLLCPPKRMP